MKRASGGKVVGSIKCAGCGEVVSGRRGSSEETEFICERADPYSAGKKVVVVKLDHLQINQKSHSAQNQGSM